MSDLPIKIGGNVPDKTMGRLGEALADLISPITETTGLIGDSLRFHRERMAERRIAAAREKADRLGLEIKKAPYKFMIGWLEAATIENEESPLNELWENLLLAGITNYETYLEMFVSILRELGGSEVKVLKALAERNGPLDAGAQLVPAMAEENVFPKLFADVVLSDAADFEVWSDIVAKHDSVPQTGFQLLGATFWKGGAKAFYYHPLYHDNFVAFELLARERLIEVDHSRAHAHTAKNGPHPDRLVEVVTARLTQLGCSFARACMYPERAEILHR